jgi:osmotically-inducible protein OsmY
MEHKNLGGIMRPDFEIEHDVKAELQYEPSVDSARITVGCRDGIVTLSGSVSSYAEEESATWATERVSGVKAVVNDLTVEVPRGQVRSDQEIAEAAVQSLVWHVQVPHTRIKVRVERGIVTLEGDVDSRYQRIAAENAVRYLTGVKAVVNLINVKPIATPGGVKAKIESALRRAAEIDAQRIKVKVRDDKVVLSGTVRSWAERSQAERAAWAAPGVREVEDNLTVAA